MPRINPEYLDAFSDDPYREELDTRSDLEIELDNMIDPRARGVNFPEWTTAEDRIKEYTDDYGDVRYNINGIPDGTGFTYNSFPNMESAQQYLMDNYWDPNEIDLPRVIQELKNTRAINTGGIPKYLQGKNPGKFNLTYEDFNPMDSSTWRIPAPEKDRLGNLQETVKYQTPDESNFALDFQPGNNLLDYYAEQGNPELQRGNSTGFFPTKNYPEFAIDQLQGIVDNNQLIQKYNDSGSAGHYDAMVKEIGVERNTVGRGDGYNSDGSFRDGYTYGSPGNRYRKENSFLNEVLGHEGMHMDEDRDDWYNSITQKVPYPFNSYYHDYDKVDNYGRPKIEKNPFASTHKRQAAILHPSIHYNDNQFFPSTRGGVDINRKGLENANAMLNANKNSGRVIAKDLGFTGSPENRFGAQQEANQWARDVGDMKQPTSTNSNYRGPHFNRGGIASL
tara:strand:- start:782 stop:2128 length:1347 start_codon:yes stop_codon:yes gene_type:complete